MYYAFGRVKWWIYSLPWVKACIWSTLWCTSLRGGGAVWDLCSCRWLRCSGRWLPLDQDCDGCRSEVSSAEQFLIGPWACISNSGDWFLWGETFAKKQITLLGVLITLVWIKCTWFLQNNNVVGHRMVTVCLYPCMHVPFQWEFCHASHDMVEFISLSFEPGPGQLTSLGQWNMRKCAAEAWKVCLLLLLETLLPPCGQASLRMRDLVKKGPKHPSCPGCRPRHESEAILDHSAPNELDECRTSQITHRFGRHYKWLF